MNKNIIQNQYSTKDYIGKRLDVALQDLLKISRSESQRLIKSGQIFVNENSPKASQILLGHELLTVKVVEKITKSIFVTPATIYEDSDILVIDKPSGITVHEAPGEKDITINEIFKKHFDGDSSGRAMIVHRLDKGTSGVMILAKNAKTAENLRNQFATRGVKKEYLTLVEGFPENGKIRIPLARSAKVNGQIIPDIQGRVSETDFKVLETFSGYSFISAKPKSGRTHQIRVHLAAIGYPIYGDKKYGSTKDISTRIFLHAHQISFRHPRTDKLVTYTSPLPVELRKILDSFKIE